MGIRTLAGRMQRRARHEEPQPDDGFRVHVSGHADRTRVALAGEFDLTSVDMFRGKLAEAEAEAPSVIEIDLRGLTFMDSSGLAQLFAANRRARAAGRRIVISRRPARSSGSWPWRRSRTRST